MARRGRRRRLLLTALILSSAGLMYADTHSGGTGVLVSARSAVGDVAGPVQERVAGVPRVVGSARAAIGGEAGDPERVSALERDNAQLTAQSRTTEYDRQRVAELDGLLNIAGRGQYRIVPARVIAVGPANGFSRSVTLDAGTVDGLAADQTVLNAQGLVGRVKTVSETTSTVVLAIDPSSTVGVRLENLQAGYAQGGGGAYDAPLTVDLFSPDAPVGAGDRMVTFGSREGTPFVAGVPVGEVTSVQGLTGSLTKRVLVRPFVDFGALDLVGVVIEPPRRDPRLSVLPPLPQPTPSVTPRGQVPVTAESPVPGPPPARTSPSTPATQRAVAEGRP